MKVHANAATTHLGATGASFSRRGVAILVLVAVAALFEIAARRTVEPAELRWVVENGVEDLAVAARALLDAGSQVIAVLEHFVLIAFLERSDDARRRLPLAWT
jgi:phosphoglycolate phosphatase-like HAD superfamily hydrolase